MTDMGIRQTLATVAWMDRRGDVTPSLRQRSRIQLASPWKSSSLSPIVFADVFGIDLPCLTRQQAMSIPGVARGRGILLSLIADKPLIDYRGSDRLEPQPAWLYRSPGIQGPWRRMAETLDDLIFYPWSLWGTKRGSAPSGSAYRPILEAWHIPYDDWDVDEAGRICTLDEDGQFVPADEDDVLLIPGPSEGLLSMATRALQGAVELEKAWVTRAKNPIPMIELHETIESGIEPDEAQDVVDEWAKARASENGGIAYTPNSIEARALGQYSADFFIQGRNSSRLDIAAFMQIPGSLLDASTATASLTYVTKDGDASSLDTMTVPYWCRPIEDRLSQDDVVPIGQIVRFGWAQAYTEPPGPIRTGAADSGALVDTAAEVVGDAAGDDLAATI